MVRQHHRAVDRILATLPGRDRPARPSDGDRYERFLYTMEGLPDEQKQTIEKDYMAAKVDDPAARALRVLLGTDTSALTEPLRAAWTRFMMASLHRRPAAVAEIGETFKSTLRTLTIRHI
jgi:hypothetical protein